MQPAEPRSRDRVFQFRYTVFNVNVRLDERRVEVRAGVRTSAAPLDRLQHLHVHRDAVRGVDELLLSYAAPGARLKRIRIFSDPDQSGFDDLIAALLAARPEIDARGLDRQAAWRITGSRELDGIVLPALMSAAILGLAVVFAPRIIHGFDPGEPTPVTVEALAAGDRPDSHHLRVEARVAVEHIVRADAEPDSRVITAWVPLVHAGWSSSDPVPAVLEVRNRPEAAILALADYTTVEGLLRDIAWEGLDERRRRAFVAGGLSVAAGVPVIDFGATPGDDLAIALGVLGLLTMMMLGIVLGLRRRVQAATHGTRKVPLNRPRAPGEALDGD